MNFIRSFFFPFLILLLINSISIRLYLYNQRLRIDGYLFLFFFFFSTVRLHHFSGSMFFHSNSPYQWNIFFLFVPFRHISLNICFSFIERVNATACIEISKQISHIYLHQLNMCKCLDIIMIY